MNRFKCSASLFALLCLFPTVALPGSGSITINGYDFTGDGDFAACGNWNEGLGCGVVTSGPINDPSTQAFMGPQAIYVNGFFTGNFQLPRGTLFLDQDHTHDDFSMQAWDGPSIFELRGGTFTAGRATVGKAIQSNEYRALGFGSIAPATVRLMGGTLAGNWNFVPYSSDEPGAAASRLELHQNLVWDPSVFSGIPGALALANPGITLTVGPFMEVTGLIENPGTITFEEGDAGTTQILEIEGQTTLTGGGQVVMNAPGATIRSGSGNLPDDELINVDNTIRGQGEIRTPLVNQSVIRAEGGQLEIAGSTKFENTVGRVEIASDGILKTSGFTQTGLSFGNLHIEDGGLIADRSQFSDIALSGPGAFVVPTGYVEVTGVIENPGTITFEEGDAGTTQILEIEGQTTLTGGGQVVMNAPGATIRSGSGNLPDDELINVDNTIRGQGTISVDLINQGTVRNEGGRLQLDRAVVSDGTIRAQDGTLNIGGDLEGNGRVEVASDGVLEVDGGLFKNHTVVVENGGIIDWTDPARTTIEVVDFFGDLTQMGGTYAPGASPAQSLLDGDYTLGGGGIFELEFAGLTVGLFDQLTVTGDVFLTDGYLSVLELAPFAFGAGQYFEVVDVQGSRFGQFGGLGEGALISGLSRDVFITYTAGDGNDIALYTEGGLSPAPVPLPASIPAFLAALGGLAAVRRRKVAY